jgi:hypothetical protein
MITLQQFEAKYSGQSLLWAPSPAREYLRGQCVQEICFYVDEVWGLPVIWADAYLWFTGGVYSQFYDRIPFTGNNRPPVGAVVVMGPNTPGSGGDGHIMVNLSAPAGASTFVSLDQNWGGKTVHRVTHNFNNVLGWIVPKGGKGGGTPTQGDEMIPDDDNYYWRFGQQLATFVRGRQLSREEFRIYIVGQTPLKAVEILCDSSEANDTEHAQELGQLAIKDNWQGQIYGLQDTLQKQQSINNQLNQTVTQLQSNDAADAATIKAGLDKIADLTSQLETLHDQQTDAQKAVDAAKAAAPSATKSAWFIKLLAKLLPAKK